MPNVNRQTIYQMGNVVNDVVKQATGRDPVQAISMDYVTVEQNTLMGIETLTGAEVTFVTPKSVPLLSLIADIKAKQNLHGYDYPWPAGGGTNKLYIAPFESTTMNGITFTYNNDGSITLNGTSTGRAYKYFLQYSADAVTENETYTVSWNGPPETGIGSWINFTYSDDGTSYGGTYGTITDSIRSRTITITHPYLAVFMDIPSSGISFDNYTVYINMVQGSTAGDWTPYANICPITGYTGCNISVSGGGTPTLVYPVDWESVAGTVYGGVLDAKNGKLTVTDAVIASYNGEELPSTWISDRDVYAEGTTPSTGAQVVYKLAEPVEYDVVELSVSTRAGENTISADTGNITLSYYVYHDLI